MKPIIGIIGGIGGGKSLVAGELVKRGGYLIAGDLLGHEALRQPDIKARAVERWGRAILDEGGEIRRRLLGKIVFADVQELRALEGLVFPFIGNRIRKEIDKANDDPAARLIVLDAAVMMEAGWDRACDKVIFVDAPRAVRLQRLLANRGWSEREVTAREKAQLPLPVKQARADGIVDNAGPPEKAAGQIDKLLREWGMGTK